MSALTSSSGAMATPSPAATMERIAPSSDAETSTRELKAAQQKASYSAMSEKQLTREIKRLEKEMGEYARNLEFEKAAKARDELFRLKELMFGAAKRDEEGEG